MYNTQVRAGLIISKFYGVYEYNGNQLNRRPGNFVSPNNGSYLVFVSLHEFGDKIISVSVYVDGWLKFDTTVNSAFTNAAGSAVVQMFKVTRADKGAELSADSRFCIISL